MDEPSDNAWLDKQSENILKSQFPLHSSIRDGNMEMMLSLLKSGRFDIYEEDGLYGWTPVHWAAHFGKLDILRKLVSMSVDASPVVWSSRKQVTPAHLASLSGHPHCLQWLLHAGTDPNIQDFLGDTPLHKAARVGSMECISLLTAQGCALGLRNHDGHTASQVAAIGGFHECALHLEKSLQFQEQAMAANIVTTYNCNNNNIHASSNPVSGTNGHCKSDGQLHYSEVQNLSGDVDMGCDMDTATEESMHKPHFNGCKVTNGFHVPLQNCFGGNKRGRDDAEEEVTKRRRCNERPSYCDEATSDNNNILSSYNAVLAISAAPRSPSIPSGHSSDTNTCQTVGQADVIPDPVTNMQLNSSVVEHQSTVNMQTGYDSLLLSSFTSQQ